MKLDEESVITESVPVCWVKNKIFIINKNGDYVLRLFRYVLPVFFGTQCSLAQMNSVEQKNNALEEFETHISLAFDFSQKYQLFSTQQRDEDAIVVHPTENHDEYAQAVNDQYYGYKLFILVDKSISSISSKKREGSVRQPQTMYVYERQDDNSLKLIRTYAVSTGKEPSPGKVDTREGFTRIQSAQAKYVSRKYGEAMPFSLWFESEYGTAIHQTTKQRCDSLIGRRASAGCIRLCEGNAEDIFKVVTDEKYSRNSPIVLLDKRSGRAIVNGVSHQTMSVNQNGEYSQAPKVIRGYPAFVRIIDGQNQQKIKEIENIINNPTEGFKQYFLPISEDVLQNLPSNKI